MSGADEAAGGGGAHPAALDWGDGDYSRIAVVLEPAAGIVLDLAGVSQGDRVLDVACGTGNAAIAAAARGARVVGVDLSETLLEIARGRAAEAGTGNVEFVAGDAVDLPVAAGAFDVAVSVFGVIFAPDATAAVGAMLTAVRPGGTIAIASWIGRGPIHDAGAALRAAFPREPDPRSFDWDRPASVRDLLDSAGAREISQHEGEVEFRATSAADWFDDQESNHPVWRWARGLLPPERWEAVRVQSIGALSAGNDDSGAFRVRSPYVVTRAVR